MIVVCFPGGAGGHYVGYLIQHLLDQTPCDKIAQVNFHHSLSRNQRFLNFSFLDHNGHSQEEELVYIKQISTDNQLILGHFRNVSAIYQLYGARIVCIRVGDRTRDLLVDRVINEAINHNFTRVKYDDVRGRDWPETNPGYQLLPKWIQLEIQSMLHKMFEYWNRQLDTKNVDPNCICELSSDDVFNGDTVQQLSGFLKCNPVPGMLELQQQYQGLVQQKYNQ